ncbi:MAG: c-type cytochrome [Verrucomicrobiales bacterium]|nr:c-type cytochrome [Verrucomicrobiales bacterium]
MKLGLIAFLCLPLLCRAVVSEDLLPHQSEWITLSSPKDQTAASSTAQTHHFRRSFVSGANVAKAILLIAADERAELWLNGTPAGRCAGVSNALSLDVTRLLKTGTNLLAVEVQASNRPPALRLMLELALNDGRQRWVVSDSSWAGGRTAPSHWQQLPDADTPDWQPAMNHGATGLKRWGDPFAATRSVDAYNSWMLAKGTGTATDPHTFQVLPGFQVELLRSALPDEDSWIALDFDPQGRLVIAREKQGLLRLTLGSQRVERVQVIENTLKECRGLLHAHGYLFVNANNDKGLYRLRDVDDDGVFEEKKLLLATEGGVGHGRNQMTLGPDGLIYIAHGDDVALPKELDPASPLQRMPDDVLLPTSTPSKVRPTARYARVGHVLQTDQDGSFFRLFAGGLRNPMDLAFDAHGQLFTYDADMERDIGAPWYHPTRVLNLVPGGDFGWRRGEGNLPLYSLDSIPSVVDIGVGSPTGVQFGTRSGFPEKYRRAFFIADWAYGRMIAVHPRSDSETSAATWEVFLSARPFNVTDFTFGNDGAMYVVTGGRGTQSGLYRVSSTGSRDPHASHDRKASPEPSAVLLSRLLPASPASPRSLNTIWNGLEHSNRTVRYTALRKLEEWPIRDWKSRALGEPSIPVRLAALLAMVRCDEGSIDEALQQIAQLPWTDLTERDRLDALRVLSAALARQGVPAPALASQIGNRLNSEYPTPSRWVNREMARILTFLRHPEVLSKTCGLLARTRLTDDLVHFCAQLAPLETEWTQKDRIAFFEALQRAEQAQGGRDYYSSIHRSRKRVADRLGVEDARTLQPYLTSQRPVALTAAKLSSSPVRGEGRDWKLEDFDLSFTQGSRSRTSGEQLFQAAGCMHCHRAGSEGGDQGPDLTSVGLRMDRRAILESVLFPSRAIDEKYQVTQLQLKDGSEVSGVIVQEDTRQLVLATGSSGEWEVEAALDQVVSRKLSSVSPMPEGLLNGFSRDQVLDLLGFLEAPADKMK